MTFSWFNTMEKKKKKRAPYFHHRMSADDLRQKIIELKSRGVTNQIICKDLQIGGSTIHEDITLCLETFITIIIATH